jgi:hypothetical protein
MSAFFLPKFGSWLLTPAQPMFSATFNAPTPKPSSGLFSYIPIPMMPRTSVRQKVLLALTQQYGKGNIFFSSKMAFVKMTSFRQ